MFIPKSQLVALQCLSAAHMELPSHLVLTSFEDARQSVHMCHPPNAPEYSFSSSGLAFWHIWIVLWTLERQHRMRRLPVSGVRPRNQLTSGPWDWKLVTSCWNLRFADLNVWGLTSFLRNIVMISPISIFLLGLAIFLNVCNALPFIREWKYFILISSVSWLWTFRLVWNRSSNSSTFSNFLPKVGIVVVRDFESFEILLMVSLKFMEFLLLANCWRANKIWLASIVAGLMSMRNCGWLVERAFFFNPKEVPREQYGISYWTPVTIWNVSSGSESVKLLVRQAENSTSD